MVALSADKNWYLLCAEFRTQGLRQPEIRDRIGAASKRCRTTCWKAPNCPVAGGS